MDRLWINMCITCEYLVNNSLIVHTLSSLEIRAYITKVYKLVLSIGYTIINHSFYTAINLSFILNLRQKTTFSTLSTNTITITTKKNI